MMILFCWFFSYGMQLPTLIGVWGNYYFFVLPRQYRRRPIIVQMNFRTSIVRFSRQIRLRLELGDLLDRKGLERTEFQDLPLRHRICHTLHSHRWLLRQDILGRPQVTDYRPESLFFFDTGHNSYRKILYHCYNCLNRAAPSRECENTRIPPLNRRTHRAETRGK